MNRNVSFAALSLLSVVLGCSAETPSSPAPAAVVAHPVDDAIADAETGRDLPRAKTRLDALLGDATLSQDDHAKVALALSSIVEKDDRERAIQLTEDALRAAGGEAAQKRLFTLLTGAAPPSPWSHRGPSLPAAQSARALAKYFPAATPDRRVEPEVEIFGGSDDGSNPSRTFDIGAGLRELAIEACGLCSEVKTSISLSSSQHSAWTTMPRRLKEMESALVVTYVDADMLPPARYEQWFAASIADLKSAFEEGDGLVAVKERPGAPPLVTIAAPRVALLPLVEAKFAEMSELPLRPTRVAVDTHLSRDEIRSGVRTRFGAYKDCYEKLTARKSGASGSIEMAFGIKADGTLTDVQATSHDGLDDAGFRSCVTDVARTMRYPRWSRKATDVTTVRYPILFAR